MSGHLPRVLTPSNGLAVAAGGATETVVGTISGVNTDDINSTVTLYGFLELIVGTSGVAAVVKCHRGTEKTGHEVPTAITKTVTAANKEVISFVFFDQPGLVAGASYVITVTQTSAAANGEVTTITLAGFVN